MRYSLRRGLSLLELMLALAITAMVATAIAGMLAAVSSGTHTRRDARSAVLTGNALATRLAGYVSPARAFLDRDPERFVLWLNDDRQSDSVHATEIRWFMLNEDTGEFRVHFVRFPDAWTQTAKDLEDQEYPGSADWWSILAQFEALGWTASVPLADDISTITIELDTVMPQEARHLTVEVTFTTGTGPFGTVVPVTLKHHQPPVN